jgi:YVTN family beta-propeller protein
MRNTMVIVAIAVAGFLLAGCGDENGEKPDAIAPASPTNLEASSLPGKIVLSWSAVELNEDGTSCDDLRGYYVSRQPSFGSASPAPSRGAPVADPPAPARSPTNDRPFVTQTSYEDTDVQEGSAYTYWVNAADDAGNESLPSDSLALLHDTEAPIVTLDQPLDGALFGTDTVTVSGTVQDAQPISQVTILVNSLPVTADVSQGAYSRQVILNEGDNTIEAQATDAAGRSGSSGVVTVTVDLTAVIVDIATPVDGSLVAVAQQLLSGTVSDVRITQALLYLNEAAPVTLTVTGGAFSRTVTLQEGANTLTVEAENDAGTQGSDAVTVTVDTVGPEVVILSPVDGSTVTDSVVSVVGTIDDPQIPVVVVSRGAEVDSVVPVGGSFSTTVELQEGINIIVASAVDAAGNPGSDQTTVTLDAAGPTVTITAPADGQYFPSSPITVSGWVDDVTITTGTLAVNGVNTTIPIDQGIFTVTGVQLQEGYNTLQVRVVDSFGREGLSTLVGVTLDTTAPEVDLSSPTQSYKTNVPQLDVELLVQEEVGLDTVVVVLNGVELGAQAQGADLWSRTVSLSEGPNTVSGMARDIAGNEGSSDEVTVTLDTVAEIEEVTHDAAGTVVLVGEVINFRLDANETGGTASVDILPVHNGIALYDDGTHGDPTAGDGVYGRAYIAQTADEVVSGQVVGHFTDEVGNVASDAVADDPITINAPPPAVTLSSPGREDVTSSSVTLQWSQSAAVDFHHYRVFRGEVPGVDTLDTAVGSEITNPSVTTVTDTDPSLQRGHTYYYRVFVWDSLGQATGSNEVSATIDVWPSRVRSSITVGPWPVQIARMPRQGLPDLAYVTHYNDSYLNVTVINTGSNAVETTIDVGSKTVGVARDPWDRSMLVTCVDSSSVLLLDPTTHTVITEVPLSISPWGMGAMAGYDDLPYAAVGGDGGVTVISLIHNEVYKEFDLGNAFAGTVTCSPDIFRFFVGSWNLGQIYVLDAEYWQVVATMYDASGPAGMSVSGDNLYVANSPTDELVVFNKHTYAVIARVPVGDYPIQVAQLPGQPYVYVSNYNDGTLSVVNTSTWEEIDEVRVWWGASGPRGLLPMPDGQHVYVVIQSPGTVSLIGY